MEKSAVYHISEHNYSYAVSEDTLNVRIKAKSGDFDTVFVHYKNLYDHTEKYYVKEMTPVLNDGISVMYEAGITVKEKHFKYYFELRTPDNIVFYTADGFLDNVVEGNCFYFPVINSDEIINLPKWAEGAIIYQIIIDRFYDGNKNNNPPKVKKPYELPDRNTYYGGDFEGIIKKLDYIESLGTKIIYLSPVFLSPTYHKYDVKDYYKIEDIYGGEDGLKALINESHKKGIKIVLDAVFNHCSSENKIFQDVIKNGEKSEYKDWFFIESYPVDTVKCNYDTFAGEVPTMPRFNTANPEVIDYLTEVALFWTKELNLDGWRLDVSDEVSHTLWQEFRRKLKAYNSDVLIIGEVWNHASKWLQGNEFDTVTNYKYRKWILDFANNEINSQVFWEKLNSNKMLYKTPLNNYMVNLVGSHDTVRSATYLKDDNAHTLVMLLTLAMDGIPLIYYGDELAMQGDEDPDNRRAMNWDLLNSKSLKAIKELGQLRKNNSVLSKGNLESIPSVDRVIAFKRILDGKSLTVIANFGIESTTINGNFSEILTGEGKITDKGIQVDKKQFVVVR